MLRCDIIGLQMDPLKDAAPDLGHSQCQRMLFFLGSGRLDAMAYCCPQQFVSYISLIAVLFILSNTILIINLFLHFSPGIQDLQVFEHPPLLKQCQS